MFGGFSPRTSRSLLFQLLRTKTNFKTRHTHSRLGNWRRASRHYGNEGLKGCALCREVRASPSADDISSSRGIGRFRARISEFLSQKSTRSKLVIAVLVNWHISRAVFWKWSICMSAVLGNTEMCKLTRATMTILSWNPVRVQRKFVSYCIATKLW